MDQSRWCSDCVLLTLASMGTGSGLSVDEGQEPSPYRRQSQLWRERCGDERCHESIECHESLSPTFPSDGLPEFLQCDDVSFTVDGPSVFEKVNQKNALIFPENDDENFLAKLSRSLRL